MSQTKHDIESLLASANMHPRRRFGQNFMIDQNIVRLVADAGEIQPGDLVIEVGPGTGTLTEELLSRKASVLAVEIDRDLAQLLRQRLGDRPNFQLIQADALAQKHAINAELASRIHNANANGQTVRLIANLPYNIASPLVIELLISGVSLLAFTVQKEVALRLAAGANGDAYGPLSVMAQLLSEVEILRTLPRQIFWPAPSIDSALVRLRRANRLGDQAGEFGQFLHKVFSYRRKTLRKALAEAGYLAEQILPNTTFDPQSRPEELSPADFVSLFQAVQRAAVI